MGSAVQISHSAASLKVTYLPNPRVAPMVIGVHFTEAVVVLKVAISVAIGGARRGRRQIQVVEIRAPDVIEYLRQDLITVGAKFCGQVPTEAWNIGSEQVLQIAIKNLIPADRRIIGGGAIFIPALEIIRLAC